MGAFAESGVNSGLCEAPGRIATDQAVIRVRAR
jgi:hypothetical protein